jgi:hypothetical protein
LEDIMQQQQIFSIEPFRIPDWPEVIENWHASYDDAKLAFNCVRMEGGGYVAVTELVVGVWIERPGRAGEFVPYYEADERGNIRQVSHYGGPTITPKGTVKRRSTAQRKTLRCPASAALYVDAEGNSSWMVWIGHYGSIPFLGVGEGGEPVDFDEIPLLAQHKIAQQMRPLAARLKMGGDSVLRWILAALNRKH